MKYVWKDYSTEYSSIVQLFFDSEAISMTGLDESFENYVSAVIDDNANYPGAKDYFKVIFEENIPIAVVAYGMYEGIVTIAEIVVALNERGKGKGTQIICELLDMCTTSANNDIKQFRTVIFPNNIASQRAFEKAGFRFESAHEDGDAWYYVYE